jgi:putative methionine-R-sulfoxide reductase with GAF domain
MRDLAYYSDSSIYIASDGGLLHFDPIIGSHMRVLDTTNTYNWDDITSVHTSDSLIWFADNEKQLYAITQNGYSHQLHSIFKLKEQITDILTTDNIIWAGTSSGLFAANRHEKAPIFQVVVPDISISQILLTDSLVWVGTFGEGLYSLRKDTIGTYEHHISKLGATTNLIYALTEGKNGEIWLNTDGGTVSYNPMNGTYLNLLELGIGKRSPILQLPDNSIVSGVYRSINRFDPNIFLRRGDPPQPYFTKINVANREEAFELAPHRITHVTLRPNERELVVEYNALNYNTISTTEFQYRVTGLIEEWQNVGRQQYLNLNNLQPGTYGLEINALNAYGGSNVNPCKLSITVLQPIYQRWWFRLSTLLFVLAIILVVINRLRLLRERRNYAQTVAYFAHSRYAENSVDEILWDVARNVISRLNFEDCVVYLYDTSSEVLVQKAAYGAKNPQGRNIINPLKIQMGDGIVGYAAEHQTTLNIPDVSMDPRYITDLQNKKSELAVPIIHQGQTIGVIDTEHSRKKYFTKEHANVLSLIAKECAHHIAEAIAAEEIQKREHDLLSVKKEIAELKLTALQAQMNPHFIFNSLNSINWYILKNKSAEASTYLTKFSKLVRLILDNSKSLSIPLLNELEALRLYLDLEAMRFEDTFDYAIQTDDEVDLEVVMIPPLILQPFVENAIWHGLLHKEGKGNLLIQIYPDNGHLKCIVQDDGIGRRASVRLKAADTPTHESKGLKLTSDRIRLLHKDYIKENTIRVIDLVDANGLSLGTRVEVLLPY